MYEIYYLGAVVAMIYGSWIYNYLFNRCLSPLLSQSGRGVQHYVIKFVSDLRQISGFLLRFPPWYNWTIVENGVKHHQPNKQTSMILIKSTLKNVHLTCPFVRFNLFPTLQFLLGFLIPCKVSVHLYCVCQILVFNKINTIVTDTKGNITQDRQNSLGSWYTPWNWYFPRLRYRQYNFYWSVPRPLGSLYYTIIDFCWG